jgi:sarcosine oxidase
VSAVRIAIVGGGVIGLLSAVECALAGHDVWVLDQDTIPSPNATSYDHHRIVRALHIGDPAVTAAALLAYHRWIELQRILNQRFCHRVGSLSVLGRHALADGLAALLNAGAHAKVFDNGTLAHRYPHLSFVDGATAVLEEWSGVLLSNRVLAACLHWLKRQPRVALLPHHAVVRVDAEKTVVHLAGGGSIDADGVIVAAGPWSRRLVPRGMADWLVLHRQSTLYCAVPPADRERWRHTPAIPVLGTPTGAWLVPPVAGTPLKVSANSACRVVDEIDDRCTPRRWIDHLTEVFAGIIPGFDADWVVRGRDCYYLAANTPSGQGVLTLGRRVVAFAGCGGGAFKFAPLIARSLMSYVTVGGNREPAVIDPLPTFDLATQGGRAQ